MKRILSLGTSLLIGTTLFMTQVNMSSCKKDTTTVVHDTTTVLYIAPPTITSLLIEKQWEFDSAYVNYTGPGTGTLTYARGASNNPVNLDSYWDEFWPDGSCYVFNEGGNNTYAEQPWGLSPTDSTLIIYPPITGRAYISYTRLLKIDSTHINYYDSTGGNRYVLILKP
jgi:hypothetical protein